MKFNIVPIQEKHIDAFWSAVDSVARERQFLAFLEGPPIQSTTDFVLEQINNNWPQVVAMHKEQLVGWCDISPLDRPIFAHIGSLGMGVLAPHRGQGIGNALISTALQMAREKSLTRIELTVREHNKPAIALYEKYGFVVEGVHKNGVCIDGKYENHVFMALLFNS